MDVKRPRFRFWYVIAALVAIFLIQDALRSRSSSQTISYSELKTAIAAGEIREVTISRQAVTGLRKETRFEAVRVDDDDLLSDLQEHDVKVTGLAEKTLFNDWMLWIFPVIVVFLSWRFFMQRFGHGQSGLMSVGQSKAKVYVEQDIPVRFHDVAGVDEAKDELIQVIEFLKTPEKFRRLGGKIPKGILLVGPPGTGKTLLARAVAGEAKVPFFSISGSEFVELFVGVGASRVRDLFLKAKNTAPCIIFIDELDALGRARGLGPMAHEEREQTLNQLLVEMDGFDTTVGVILLAATNRPEILDPALLRAGRFDRHVLVDRPHKVARLEILEVHARGVVLSPAADLRVIASMTAGFVGADLANVINEAALLAVRREKEAVGPSELQEAVERIVGGLEKKNRVLSSAEKERVAYHEIGHALLAMSIPGFDAIQKISIVPRGIAALGYTLQLPTEDRFLMTRSELENKIAVLLGGRVAEEIIYREVSTGARDDLLKATDIARAMIKSYGMSDKLGQLSLDRDHRSTYLNGGEGNPSGEYSAETAREIDLEVRRLLDEQHGRATALLDAKKEILRHATTVLLEKETLSGEELMAIISNEGHAKFFPPNAAALSAHPQ